MFARAAAGLYFTGDGCRRDEDGYYWMHRPHRRRAQRGGP
jgi:acyl-coenzyme A synthetase/AMP-(fatty) acid ligase